MNEDTGGGEGGDDPDGEGPCKGCGSATYKLYASPPYEEGATFGCYVKGHTAEPVGYRRFSFKASH